MTFTEIELNIRNYRKLYVIHPGRILIVSLFRDDFDDKWTYVKPERKFYDNGRRRIQWLIDSIGGIGYTCLNILQPDPDDVYGAWIDSVMITWQQIVDEELPR